MITEGKITLAQLDLKKGSLVPRHEHASEQISYVLSGSLRFWMGPNAAAGDESASIVVAAGEVLAIPGGLPHRVRAIEDSLSIDIFTPPREDWLSGRDDYLRSG